MRLHIAVARAYNHIHEHAYKGRCGDCVAGRKRHQTPVFQPTGEARTRSAFVRLILGTVFVFVFIAAALCPDLESVGPSRWPSIARSKVAWLE
jgi:hypothetical protein